MCWYELLKHVKVVENVEAHAILKTMLMAINLKYMYFVLFSLYN